MNNFKCHACWTKPEHRFSECLSVECCCQCVREVYSKGPNLVPEDVAADSPNFLKINNVEIKGLPDATAEVKEFNKIDRSEWLPKKKIDKRFKRRVR